MVDVAGLELTPEDRDVLRHPLVGSVILFTRNYADSEQLARLVAEIHAVRTPALVVAVDQEGGRVQRFRAGFSALPSPRRIGHEFDVDAKQGVALARAMGWLMAAELRAHGVDLSFAPCVDLDYRRERGHRRSRVPFEARGRGAARARLHAGHERRRHGRHRQTFSRPRRGRRGFAPVAAGR